MLVCMRPSPSTGGAVLLHGKLRPHGDSDACYDRLFVALWPRRACGSGPCRGGMYPAALSTTRPTDRRVYQRRTGRPRGETGDLHQVRQTRGRGDGQNAHRCPPGYQGSGRSAMERRPGGLALDCGTPHASAQDDATAVTSRRLTRARTVQVKSDALGCSLGSWLPRVRPAACITVLRLTPTVP